MGKNIFADAQLESQKRHSKTENKVKGDILDRPKRVVLSLSITESDKLKLQQYALKQGLTAAGLIHRWIEMYCDED